MEKLPSGNWKKEWTDYNGEGPATTYYRKREIVAALKHYGHTGEEDPDDELTPYTDAGFLVAQNVTPYRTVR